MCEGSSYFSGTALIRVSHTTGGQLAFNEKGQRLIQVLQALHISISIIIVRNGLPMKVVTC